MSAGESVTDLGSFFIKRDAMAVLDEWLDADSSRSLEADSNHPYNAIVRLCGRFGVRGGRQCKRFQAATLELARAAAARAIEAGEV